MHSKEVHRPGTTAGDTGCDVEQHRHGIIKGGAQPQHWRLPSCKQLIHGHLRNANLEMEKTDFRDSRIKK